MKAKKIKAIPKFSSEDEEREFWNTHDSDEYFDMSKAQRVTLPNLKPTDTDYLLSIPNMCESIIEGLKTPIEECSKDF